MAPRQSEISNRDPEIRGVYAGGVVGRDHDHRHPDRAVVAGGAGGPRGGTAGAVRQQSQTVGPGLPESRTSPGILPDRRLDAALGGRSAAGFNRKQPAGWTYNILPYAEQEALWRLPDDGQADAITPQQIANTDVMLATPVAMFICPTRRQAVLYPMTQTQSIWLLYNGDTFTLRRPAPPAATTRPTPATPSAPAARSNTPTICRPPVTRRPTPCCGPRLAGLRAFRTSAAKSRCATSPTARR